MLSPIPSVSLVDPEDADALVCLEQLQFMEQLTPCSSVSTMFSNNECDSDEDEEDDIAIRAFDPATGLRSQSRYQLFKPDTLTNDLSDEEEGENEVELTLVNSVTTVKSAVKLSLILRFVNSALNKLQSTGDCPTVTIDSLTTNHLLIYIYAHLRTLAPEQQVSYINQIKVLHLGKSFSITKISDLAEINCPLTTLNLKHSPCFHFLICQQEKGCAMAPDNLVLQTMISDVPDTSVTYAEAIVKKFRKLTRRKRKNNNTASEQARELRRKHRIRQSVTFFVHAVM